MWSSTAQGESLHTRSAAVVPPLERGMVKSRRATRDGAVSLRRAGRRRPHAKSPRAVSHGGLVCRESRKGITAHVGKARHQGCRPG